MARKLTTFFALICIFNALTMISAQASDDLTDLSHDTETNNSTTVITLDNPAEIYAEDKSEPQIVTPDVAQNSDELIHDLDNNPETVDENANVNNNSTTPATVETTETKEEDTAFVPAAPVANETIANNSYSIKMLLAGIFSGVFILFLVLTCHYRIQMQRYKMAPFTPPRYCPEFLFPRADSEKNNSNDNNRTYQAIEVGDYHPPNPHNEF